MANAKQTAIANGCYAASSRRCCFGCCVEASSKRQRRMRWLLRAAKHNHGGVCEAYR